MKNIVFASALLVGLFGWRAAPTCDAADPDLTLVVMDPLAGPLACDCVQGYAQRKYEKLGVFLTKKLGSKVNVVWAENLKDGLEETKGRADLIIGKHSVVLADAASNKIEVQPLAQLTDQQESVEQTGLFVVRANDKAQSVVDLKGYRIIFGPADCEEKSAAMVQLLKDTGITVPSPMETSPSCSSAAITLMELPADVKAAAVISSYASPLLEGCKKVKKGDLRIIGESKPVPFITMFVGKHVPDRRVAQISKALDDVGLDPQLLIDLETAAGFVKWEESKASEKPSPTKPTPAKTEQTKTPRPRPSLAREAATAEDIP
jgi:ABC-type phosphate/phosphonate transport system substrate-binding protein